MTHKDNFYSISSVLARTVVLATVKSLTFSLCKNTVFLWPVCVTVPRHHFLLCYWSYLLYCNLWKGLTNIWRIVFLGKGRWRVESMRTGKEKEECKQPHLKTDTIDLGNCNVSSFLLSTLHCCQSSSKEFQRADIEGSVNLKIKDTVF